MKPLKLIGVLLFIILNQNLSSAQIISEVESFYSLTSEKLVRRNNVDLYNSKVFHSFGMNARKIFKSNFFIKVGVHFKNFGTQFDIPETTTNQPEGTSEFQKVVWKAQSIDVPLHFGFYFLNTDKLRLGIAIGSNHSFVNNQTQKLKREKSELDIYGNYISYFSSNLEIGVNISDHLILNIVPIWQKETDSFFDNLNKQISFGGQLGLSYVFD